LCGDYLAECTSYIIEVVVHGRSRRTGKFLLIGNPLDFAKGKYRWHSLDRGGFGGVRDSIKTYVYFAGFMVRRDHVWADAAAGLESGGG
jgi:hypothetical protein